MIMAVLQYYKLDHTIDHVEKASRFHTSGGGLLICLAYSGSGLFGSTRSVVSKIEGDFSCTAEAIRAIPVLKKAYGDSMRKVMHVGPETCSVVSKLLTEEEREAWGVEPYDLEDAHGHCKALVRRGIVRVADIKFPLPYRPKSFNLVMVSDALDYLSPRYLNKTLPDLARVASDGVIVFAGSPGQQRAKVAELSKFGRPAKMRSRSWWGKYFMQMNSEENEAVAKKFEQASSKMTFQPSCQIFHLKPYH
ncbi:hypothetical protein CDL15_Pgr001649 [Punica granatum]|uniref:Uncharacterized protein n=1 Tax=Punica granatum TaxID=22663 RepID=A0A218XA14_PUNGR|nr:hypothetical protein CDL15_Pgr001649 [Punica granatum]